MFFPVHPFKDETTPTRLSGQGRFELKHSIYFKTEERKTFAHSRWGIDKIFKVCNVDSLL